MLLGQVLLDQVLLLLLLCTCSCSRLGLHELLVLLHFLLVDHARLQLSLRPRLHLQPILTHNFIRCNRISKVLHGIRMV